jgi:phasin family protein
MSQKPRTGTPAFKVTAKSVPVNAVPVGKTEPVSKSMPAAKPALVVKAAPVAPPVAMVKPEPVKTAPPPAAPKVEITPKPITAVAYKAPLVTFTPKQPTITQGMKTMMKSTEDLVAFGQANMEAFVKSGQIWSAGVQELTKQIATTAKASFEESVTTFKAISTAKSVKEAMDLQSTFAKAALEKAMAESNKLTDASIKLTEQTLAPITARVTVAVETFGKAA